MTMGDSSSMTDHLLSMAVCRRLALVCAATSLCLPVASLAQTHRQRQQAGQAVAQQAELLAVPAPAPPPASPTEEHKASRLPTVTFENGALTIIAFNATLRDVLEMVHSQTGAVIDIPADANERVVVRLGPGPVRRVLDSLLVGSAYNYVVLGSAADPNALAKVILTAKPSDASDKGSAPRGAQVLGNRRESARELAPEPQAEPEFSVSATEAVAQTVSKQDDTAQDSAATPETPSRDDNAPRRASASSVAQQDYPHTPNIKSAQEVLQDLYARRRQMTEQQNSQPQTPR